MTPSAAPSLLLFWDYDTQWGADRSRSAGGPKNWGMLDFEYTERLLELHAQYEMKACFAVVGAAAEPGERPYHDPAQIRRIAEAGHEVASHSMRHEWLPGIEPAVLRDLAAQSKAVLEDCTGRSVVSFVPPFNQPFDYIARGSISFSERLLAAGRRSSLADLCTALAETGYSFCRISCVPLLAQLLKRLGRKPETPSAPWHISGITCLHTTACGFNEPALHALELARAGEFVVLYGHPHSLHAGNSQDEGFLIPLLERVRQMRRAGSLRIVTPRDLVAEGAAVS